MLIVLLVLLTSACHRDDDPLSSVRDLSAIRANLAFTCVHESDHLPPLDPSAEQAFKYGHYLEKMDGPKNFGEIARYYRIAAAHGNYKANNNLQQLISEGLVASPDAPHEVIGLADQLVKQGVPGGYYDIGRYLELGYGIKQNLDMSLRYFRKAADLGSPEAQTYVGEKLAPLDAAPTVARQMRFCAVGQGYGPAAAVLGIDLKSDKIYAEALEVFQNGVRAGDTQSTSFMRNGFATSSPSDELYYLGVRPDPERSRRYRAIALFLRRYDGLNPKVPDLDKIAPLPPAQLPDWNGSFQWEKERAALTPPQKPSDEVIERLSEERNLDPATGLPLKE